MAVDSHADAATPRFRFRTIHVMYVMALIGASLATCGVGGLVLAAIVSYGWFATFWDKRQPAAESEPRPSRTPPSLVVEILGVVAIISILIGLFFPAISTPRPVARSTICSTHLAQIARALHNYHFMYGSFPPAYVADDRDKPMHSWRVLILPFLGQQQLYDAHRFDEPWDGPNNSKLLTFVPWGYTCGAPQAGSKTSYFAVVGPDAAWSGAAAQSLDDFDGGSDAAILVLEGPADQIEWSEPRDLTWDETIELLTATPNDEGLHTDDEGFFFTRSYGRNAAMADGSVRRLPPNLSRAAAASLLHVASEDAADELDSGNHDAFRRRINWANVFRLIVLVIIVALPVPWAMRRRPLPKHRDPSAPS